MLHVVSYYPPDRVGGVGEHVRIIHEGHVAEGVDSDVLTSGITRSDPRVHRVGHTPIGFFLNSWRGVKLAKGRDVVHAHHGEGLLFLLLVRLRLRRPRLLVMFHVDVRRREAANRSHIMDGHRYGPTGVTYVLRRLGGWIKATVERLAWMLADAVVVETDAVREELSDLRPPKPVSVIPHGLSEVVNVSDATQVDPVELLFVGTPGIRKRTHMLPAILHRVRQTIPEARMRVVGFDVDGDLDLRREAERLDVLSAFDFVGSIRSEEVIPFYRSADVLVLPSAYEGLPMVLLEAMREGLVPVATAVSGHPEAIDDGVNGSLVDLDDVDAIADRCIEILRSPPSIRQELGEQARATVGECFSLDHEIESYVELYGNLHRDR